MTDLIHPEYSFLDNEFAGLGPLDSVKRMINRTDHGRIDRTLISLELQRYLPTILRSIEKWKARKSLEKDAAERKLISRRMTECVETFVSSGGQSPASSRTNRPANHLFTDLYSQILLDLFPLVEKSLLTPLCGTNGTGPAITRQHSLEQKLYSFEILTDFLDEISHTEPPEAVPGKIPTTADMQSLEHDR